MSFRRDRFGDLVRRQLDLFAEDDAALLREAEAAERAYDEADRDEAEEAYGDYQLVLEAVADRLGEIRDVYAAHARRTMRSTRTSGRSSAPPASAIRTGESSACGSRTTA